MRALVAASILLVLAPARAAHVEPKANLEADAKAALRSSLAGLSKALGCAVGRQQRQMPLPYSLMALEARRFLGDEARSLKASSPPEDPMPLLLGTLGYEAPDAVICMELPDDEEEVAGLCGPEELALQAIVDDSEQVPMQAMHKLGATRVSSETTVQRMADGQNFKVTRKCQDGDCEETITQETPMTVEVEVEMDPMAMPSPPMQPPPKAAPMGMPRPYGRIQSVRDGVDHMTQKMKDIHDQIGPDGLNAVLNELFAEDIRGQAKKMNFREAESKRREQRAASEKALGLLTTLLAM